MHRLDKSASEMAVSPSFASQATQIHSVNRVALVAANSSWNLTNFRAPVIRALQDSGFRVVAAIPADKGAEGLSALGVEIQSVSIDARGLSPLADLRLLTHYIDIMKRLTPVAFLPFTAKPNIYGSIAARLQGIPVMNTITGLGTGFLSGSAFQMVMSALYRIALRRSRRVFFHNKDDRDLFIELRLVTQSQAAVVAGSGIDLSYFRPAGDRGAEKPVTFLFIGRLLRDKGVEEFAAAAEIVQAHHSARFQILGSIEDHPKAVARRRIDEWVHRGVIELLGTAPDVRPFISDADCVVLPSYREGLPRVLLEASAMARPVIASDVPGCREAVDAGVTGLLCEARSVDSLVNAMMRFVHLPASDRAAMGRAGRAKAEREFSHELVAKAYVDELDALSEHFASLNALIG
jgi:glycosyltransferase involved in cell wall biosynthesis